MVNISPNWSLFVQMLNFLILIWALNFVLYRPIRGIIAQRREKVTGLERGIAQHEEDQAEKDKALKAGIKEAREEGQKHKEALEEEAREYERQKLAEINEKARADLADIKDRVSREAEDARKSLQPKIDQFADQISEKILGRAL